MECQEGMTITVKWNASAFLSVMFISDSKEKNKTEFEKICLFKYMQI